MEKSTKIVSCFIYSQNASCGFLNFKKPFDHFRLIFIMVYFSHAFIPVSVIEIATAIPYLNFSILVDHYNAFHVVLFGETYVGVGPYPLNPWYIPIYDTVFHAYNYVTLIF